METGKDTELINVLIPLLIIVFIIAVGVVMLYQHFQKNLYMRRLHEETLKRNHQLELLRASIAVQEEERKRIAQDLHDELGAVLSIMRMNLMMLEQENNTEVSGIRNVRSLSENALANMRSISHRLMPPQLEAFGLIKTLESVAEQINMTGNIDVVLGTQNAPLALSWQISLGLYRVIMELLNNTIKHSGASQVLIDIEESDDAVLCRYSDNGRGMSAESTARGLGHKSIGARISALEGSFIFGSPAEAGFSATIILPIQPVPNDLVNF